MRITEKELLRKLEGIHNIESLAYILNVPKKKAVYYIHRLRKKGYVKTKKDRFNRRIYDISFENRLKGVSYIDIINQNSPIKISSSEDYKIYGKTPSIEETLIYAVKSAEFRKILASLALFKKINNWSELYKLAKLNKLKRKIGALYDLSRRIMRTRRMTKKFRKNCLPPKNAKYEFIINKLSSKDFKDIEKVWKVYLLFNIKDLEDYKK